MKVLRLARLFTTGAAYALSDKDKEALMAAMQQAHEQNDYTRARNLLEKAAMRGVPEAQYNLGILYAEGRSVPQDYAQARQWWEKAAAQGDADAQYNLGVLYLNGDGVPQDIDKARAWYEKAAAQGKEKAKQTLQKISQKTGKQP